MKTTRKTRERGEESGGALKLLFVDLNVQLQSYLNALKTSSSRERTN